MGLKSFNSLTVVLFGFMVLTSFAFSPVQLRSSLHSILYRQLSIGTSSSYIFHMNSFFQNMGTFFDGLGSNDNKNEPPNSKVSEESVSINIDGIYTGSKRILTIPAKSMKTGGLRLYCSLYLMGLQNTPELHCWKAQQFDSIEVNLRYCDLSGSIIVRFNDDEITVDRLGSTPSMKYLMHEAIVLNGFLDELQTIVFEGNITEANRLLILSDPSALEKARSLISFA